mmetsp:Transcript_4304/g.8513  ORF Transcript_4304/g.8513 Transcript_4304/m.8513 type:complete len:296 (+) Transcript_4304:188-1075(+)
MSTNEQVLEFHQLTAKALKAFFANPDKPLLEVFANFAYGGVPETKAEEEPSAEPVVEETPVAEVETEESKESAMKAEAEEEVPAAGQRVAPGGASSIVFGDDSLNNVRSSTKVRQPAGGRSTLQLGGGNVETQRSSTRVRVAPGGASTLQLGGPSLEKDNTRASKKKKEEVSYADTKPLPTPREMSLREGKSQILGAETKTTKVEADVSGLEKDTNAQIVAAVAKFDKLKAAFMEFVGDSSGKLMTPESFADGCKRLGIAASDDYVKTVFEVYDKKKSGTIGISSFTRYVNKISF